MKIKLSNETEYQTTDVHITENNQLCVALTGLTEVINETIVRKSLTTEAMSKVTFYKDDVNWTVYEGYTVLDYYNVKAISEDSFDMTIYFNKSENNARLEKLENCYDVLFDTTNLIATDLLPSIKISI